jgi:saccharopine dehydrogenase-like NADP-dependent oxidoreductase
LPYHQTKEIALWCIDNEFRYCDLGGRVDVSKEINEWAKKDAVKPVFTDLGLAPGWVNILAEYGCSQIHRAPETVSMMVGGLPAIKTNPPLNYATTWSVDGLINEYRDDCEVLADGEIETVKGMSGRRPVSFELLEGEELEAFFTSGGASHTIRSMKSKGVKNCFYKTIRYKGHCDVVRFLFNTAELSDECINNIFKTGCKDATGDIVLIKSEVIAGDITWKKEFIVGYDLKFSAMQKATAFSISSVAKIMAEGHFDDRKVEHRGYKDKLPVVLKYSDVPYEKFEKNLKELGL